MVEEANSRPEMSLKAAISRSIGCLWLFLGLQLSLSFSLSFFLGVVEGVTGWSSTSADSIGTAVILMIVTLVSGLITAAVGSKMLDVHLIDELKNTRFDKSWLVKSVPMGYCATFVCGLLVTVINLVLSILFGKEAAASSIDSIGWIDGIVNVITVVVLAPVFEELIFRGLIFKSLSKWNAGFAVVLSGILFGMAHLNLVQGIAVGALGMIFAYLYYRSGSILVPIFAHMVNNAIALLADIDSPVIVSVLGLAILVLAIIGLVLIIQQRKQFAAMFAQCAQASQEWSITVHRVSFWIFIALFVIGSIVMLV